MRVESGSNPAKTKGLGEPTPGGLEAKPAPRPVSFGARAAPPLASAYVPAAAPEAHAPLRLRNLVALLDQAGGLDPERDRSRLASRLRAAAKQLLQLGQPGAGEPNPHSKPLSVQALIGDLPDPRDSWAGLRFLAHTLRHSPSPPARVLGLLQLHPNPAQVLAHAAKLYPGIHEVDRPRVERALRDDLQLGQIGEAIEGRLGQLGFSPRQIEQFFSVFAEVREGFRIGAELGDDMQRVNWLHTRVEVLHTLEIASAMGLSKSEAQVALYGSLFSDAFKDGTRHSLLWHNRPGAELIAPAVLGRHLDLTDPEQRSLLSAVMRVAHEHQVTPPMFMAGPMRAALSELLVNAPEAEKAEWAAAIERIVQKVAAPLDAPQRHGEIEFPGLEQALLSRAGLPGWAVPHDSPWHNASVAAIVGDVAQYVSWEGIIKIAVDLRDPGLAAPFMRDPIWCSAWLEHAAPAAAQALAAKGQSGAVESSIHFSFGQGLSVVKDPRALSAMAKAKATSERQLKQDVLPEIERRLRAELAVPPGVDTPPIPYWNQPIAAPGALTEQERAMADRVKRVAAQVMAELGGVPLDPFGAKREERHEPQ